MVSPSPILRRPALESFPATIVLDGQEFTFKVHTRPLPLGDSVTVNYYWLDSRQFRHLRNKASAVQFRNTLGHWAAAMRASGWQDDLDQQVHYVMAQCYPLISRCKSLQDVYRDACLAPSVVKSPGSLSQAVRQHIQEIVGSRDRLRVQAELDRVLGRFEPHARVLPLLQEAFRNWAGKGVHLMRTYGNVGVETFLRATHHALDKYRKRSNRWVRDFINLFAYESKVSFYLCYANLWVALIPWLRQHRGLDEISERFLRFWHCQNQPVEIPHGRTASGIYYVTHGRATMPMKQANGKPLQRSLIWKTDHVGPTHFRDVFSGQVLSLHPLSAFFMQDPQACAVAGRFFTSEGYHEVTKRGRTEYASEYWNLIGEIIAAAHLYREACDRQTDKRKVRPSRSDALESVATLHEFDSEVDLMEDYAAHLKLRCPKCPGPVRFEKYHPAPKRGGQPKADYRCTICQHLTSVLLHEAEVRRFLFR